MQKLPPEIVHQFLVAFANLQSKLHQNQSHHLNLMNWKKKKLALKCNFSFSKIIKQLH